MRCWVLGLALGLALAPPSNGAELERRRAPLINIGGVVNAASFVPAPDNVLVPNGIISIFGQDLSLRTRGVTAADLEAGELPIHLGGVSVLIGGLAAPLFYVSPLQINAQVPSMLAPGPATIRIVRESLQSGTEPVQIRAADPGLFMAAFENGRRIAIATHLDYTVVARGEYPRSTPARPGETIVLFATGLGVTVPYVASGTLPPFAAQTVLPVTAWLDGVPLPPEAVGYAGQAPRLAGVYQVNLTLPLGLASGDYEIAIEIDGLRSQPGLMLAVEP